MRHRAVANFLALGLGLATLFSASAQTTTWSGPNLVFTPLAGSTCRLAIDRAFLQGSGWSATIHVVFRNRGATPVRVTSLVELQGNGQRKSGSFGPTTIAASAVNDVTTLPPYGGSLAGSTLRVSVTACTPG